MNCWIQDGKPETHFMPTSGGASNSDDLKVAGLVPRLFLATSDDSSFCLLWGKFCFSWVLHSKSSMWCSSSLVESKIFCRCLHLGWFPGDLCRARTLDPCVSPLLLWFRKRIVSRRALATATIGASPFSICILEYFVIRLKNSSELKHVVGMVNSQRSKKTSSYFPN